MASSQARWHRRGWRQRRLIRWLTNVCGLSGGERMVGDFLNMLTSFLTDSGPRGIDYPTGHGAIVLPFMSYLRVLQIYIDPISATMSDFAILSFLMRSLCASLTSPATLEHLKLSIAFEGNDNYFDHDSFYEDLRHDDVWRYLDSIVTHPTGSRLQRVDIDITYCFRYDDDVKEPDNGGILEAVLGGLPLLRDEGILFVEANKKA